MHKSALTDIRGNFSLTLVTDSQRDGLKVAAFGDGFPELGPLSQWATDKRREPLGLEPPSQKGCRGPWRGQV